MNTKRVAAVLALAWAGAAWSQSEQETVKRSEAKIGRNDPCPCGSGKKYKKCHMLTAA